MALKKNEEIKLRIFTANLRYMHELLYRDSRQYSPEKMRDKEIDKVIEATDRMYDKYTGGE
jgi:hypothetical protein